MKFFSVLALAVFATALPAPAPAPGEAPSNNNATLSPTETVAGIPVTIKSVLVPTSTVTPIAANTNAITTTTTTTSNFDIMGALGPIVSIGSGLLGGGGGLGALFGGSSSGSTGSTGPAPSPLPNAAYQGAKSGAGLGGGRGGGAREVWSWLRLLPCLCSEALRRRMRIAACFIALTATVFALPADSVSDNGVVVAVKTRTAAPVLTDSASKNASNGDVGALTTTSSVDVLDALAQVVQQGNSVVGAVLNPSATSPPQSPLPPQAFVQKSSTSKLYLIGFASVFLTLVF
ncbi:hypothetical protein HDU79_010852 [Rhizoclosmatium sp. JEL0117]|nr:hypothetical protein HDU79_010852 [Rhizoclosmatium sp. JEL0117]